MTFVLNGILWHIEYVPSNDPRLMRSDGVLTLAVTDWNLRTVFVNRSLSGVLLRKVICHEIVHCFCFSYRCNYSEEEEEMIADFLATYGRSVLSVADNVLHIFRKGYA